jgi:hypothetical protein
MRARHARGAPGRDVRTTARPEPTSRTVLTMLACPERCRTPGPPGSLLSRTNGYPQNLIDSWFNEDASMAPSESGFFQDAFRSLAEHSSPLHWQSEFFGLFLNGEIPEALSLLTGLGQTPTHSTLLACTASTRLLDIEPPLTVRRDPIQSSLPACSFAVVAAAPWVVVGAASSQRWQATREDACALLHDPIPDRREDVINDPSRFRS